MKTYLALAFFAFILAAYLLTYSRAFDINADEGTMFAVTESLVKRGQASIDHANNLQYIHQAAIGVDGSRYAKYGLGLSLAAAPLYALALAIPALGLIDTVLLLNTLTGAATATVVLLTALELGASRRRALATALIYAFCTPAWVYAKNFYSEPLAALGFALAGWGVVIVLTRRRITGAMLAGLGLGLALLTRTSEIVAVPVLGVVLWRYGGSRRWRCAVAAGAPIAFALAAIGLYNWARFGSPFQSGYGDESFTVLPWVGAFGMLFAPGRSLFLYAPIMLMAVPGLWLLRRPAGLRVWLIGTALAVTALHGAWWSWWGGWSWGPRFLVPILPLLTLGVLALAPGCRGATARPATPARARLGSFWVAALAAALAAIGLLIQLPGVLVYRTFFFWEVMKAVPHTDPDAVSLYTFQFFMPLVNLREVLKGNLDLAWKPGFGAPVNVAGAGLACLGVMIGLAGLAFAGRDGRAGRIAAWLSPALVIGLALVSLGVYQAGDNNPYRSIGIEVSSRVPPNAILVVGDHDPLRNRALWNVNRITLRMVGVPSDTGQMQLHILPGLRRAVLDGRPIWYLQIESSPSPRVLAELRELGAYLLQPRKTPN